jgi:hypothetical protein
MGEKETEKRDIKWKGWMWFGERGEVRAFHRASV